MIGAIAGVITTTDDAAGGVAQAQQLAGGTGGVRDDGDEAAVAEQPADEDRDASVGDLGGDAVDGERAARSMVASRWEKPPRPRRRSSRSLLDLFEAAVDTPLAPLGRPRPTPAGGSTDRDVCIWIPAM